MRSIWVVRLAARMTLFPAVAGGGSVASARAPHRTHYNSNFRWLTARPAVTRARTTTKCCFCASASAWAGSSRSAANVASNVGYANNHASTLFSSLTKTESMMNRRRFNSQPTLSMTESMMPGDDETYRSRSEEVQYQIAVRNGGVPVNCHSPKQVAAAIFGDQRQQTGKQSTSKAVLQQAVAGEFPELDANSRELASLILEWRALMQNESLARPTTILSAEGNVEHDNSPGVIESQRKSISDPPQRFNNNGSSYNDLVEAMFSLSKNKIHTYWKDVLLQISRPSARVLMSQLDPEQCPMGYDPLASPFDPMRRTESVESALCSATTTAGKKGSFLAYCREQKTKHSDCVVLTRCGDFYETFGTDAILLVEYCGLNAMAGKAKAGCPVRNIQATLDSLTAAGLRVAVYEEGADTDSSAGPGATGGAKARIKSRFLAQIVSAASPTYLYDLVLIGNCADTLDAGPTSRPYVGVISLQAGYTLTEVWVEERIVRVSERLTADAVACRLAAYPPADPLFYVPSFSEYEGRSSRQALPFLPSRIDAAMAGPGVRLRTRILPPTLVQKEGSGVSEIDRAKNIVVSELLRYTGGQDYDDSNDTKRVSSNDFIVVGSSKALVSLGTQTNPLHMETATQLGLMNDRAIPSLVSYLLPDFAPVAARRFVKRLLLNPPPPTVGAAMSTIITFLKQDDAFSLPPMTIPPVGKVLSMVRAGQASAQVYGEILRALDSTKLILDLFSRNDSADVINALMTILEYESGMAADPSSLRQRCLDAIEVIEDVLSPIHHVNSISRPFLDIDDERISDFGELIPRAYFERNEVTWRGRVRLHAAPDAYKNVQDAAQRLAVIVARDFWGLEWDEASTLINEEESSITDGRKNLVVQDIFNNILALKEIPKSAVNGLDFIHPIDRFGKALRNRYTTVAVQRALSDYVSASDQACDEVSAALVRLSQTLQDKGHLPVVVQSSHSNLILSVAYYHASKANSLGWSLAHVEEGNSSIDCAGHFNSLWPYWMDYSQAVSNTFDLSGMWVLTAPNMSGKSTIMRSTAAAALLSICGLCAPLKSGSSVRRFDHIFVRGASSDIPTEQKSAFGAEMGDIASLLRCCGTKSLVFVDELGRGTSPRDGTRLSGAVLEAMAGAGMSGVFATHLHDILNLPLQFNNRIFTKRMAIHDVDQTGEETSRYNWTYRLEDGVCTDSMALVTAERFGVPSHVIQRAEELSYFLLPANTTATPLSNAVEFSTVVSVPPENVMKVVEETTGKRAVQLSPNWNVPASFDGKSAVYVLKLSSDPPRFYVGQTDNLRQRIEQHRSKGGYWNNLEAYFVSSPKGKSEARTWESLLIQKMATAGFDMQNTADGRTLRRMNNE